MPNITPGSEPFPRAYYRNGAHLAFWDSKEDIGKFGGEESSPYYHDDPSRETVIGEGRNYEEALTNVLADMRTEAGAWFDGHAVEQFLEEARSRDEEFGPHAHTVWVGIIAGLYH